MKPPIYLTDPKEMLKVRLNQPRVSSEQARTQRERLKRALNHGLTPKITVLAYAP